MNTRTITTPSGGTVIIEQRGSDDRVYASMQTQHKKFIGTIVSAEGTPVFWPSSSGDYAIGPETMTAISLHLTEQNGTSK